MEKFKIKRPALRDFIVTMRFLVFLMNDNEQLHFMTDGEEVLKLLRY